MCDTHDMLGCRCAKDKKKLPAHLRGKVTIGELDSYEHYDDLANIKVTNVIVPSLIILQGNTALQKAGAGIVSFVMVNSKLPAPPEPKQAKGEENIVVETAVNIDENELPSKKENKDNNFESEVPETAEEESEEEEEVESESESESESEAEESEESDG